MAVADLTPYMETLRSWIKLPNRPYAALDVAAGDGRRLLALVGGSPVHAYMVSERDTTRACRKACLRAKGLGVVRDFRVIKGWLSDVRISRNAASLLIADTWTGWGAPYLRRVTEYLRAGGVLALLAKQADLSDLNRVLAAWYTDVRVFRLPDPAFAASEAVIVLGVRQKSAVRNRDVEEYLAGLADAPADFLEVLSAAETPVYEPVGAQPELPVFNTTVLDAEEAEELARGSPVWNEVGRLIAPPPIARAGRPITPLLSAHIAELLASGEFNGVMGRGENRHLVAGQVVKSLDVDTSTEEAEEGRVTTTIEKEDFKIAVVVLTPSGQFIDLT